MLAHVCGLLPVLVVGPASFTSNFWHRFHPQSWEARAPVLGCVLESILLSLSWSCTLPRVRRPWSQHDVPQACANIVSPLAGPVQAVSLRPSSPGCLVATVSGSVGRGGSGGHADKWAGWSNCS